MSHQSVRTLIEDTVKAVDDAILFAYARASDFNTMGVKTDKRVRLDPLKCTVELSTDNITFTKNYSIGMVFYRLDDLQGAEEQTKEILDSVDVISDKFLAKLNKFFLETDTVSDTIELSGISKEPVIKVTVDCVTGFILTFNMTVPDDFNYCDLYDE